MIYIPATHRRYCFSLQPNGIYPLLTKLVSLCESNVIVSDVRTKLHCYHMFTNVDQTEQ